MPKLLKHSTYRARALRHTATPAEQLMWQALRGHKLRGAKFRRQQPLGPYIVDFFCDQAALVIELDGAHHFPPPPSDLQRDAFMRSVGLRVLRFENREVFHSLQAVLLRIESFLSPLPPGEAG